MAAEKKKKKKKKEEEEEEEEDYQLHSSYFISKSPTSFLLSCTQQRTPTSGSWSNMPWLQLRNRVLKQPFSHMLGAGAELAALNAAGADGGSLPLGAAAAAPQHRTEDYGTTCRRGE
eukprot:evm.model.NODE_1241_length_51861_cov_21.854361.14